MHIITAVILSKVHIGTNLSVDKKWIETAMSDSNKYILAPGVENPLATSMAG